MLKYYEWTYNDGKLNNGWYWWFTQNIGNSWVRMMVT
jgi:hypothetical protein